MRSTLPLLVLLALAACRTKPQPDDSAPEDTGPEVVDLDSDGYDSTVDCDDGDASVHPDAVETCDDRDEDCDGEVDEGLRSTWYADEDGDGWGDPANAVESCEAPSGFVSDATDCDDANPAVHPQADEICNGVDDDCDGEADEGLLGTWYTDADGDGWGDDATATVTCAPTIGQVDQGGDCDDSDTAFHPGAAEGDCADPHDYNCDGSTGYADADADGWAACQDCDDDNVAVNPGATEVCDGVDNDCSGVIDDDYAVDVSTWYDDDDGDGYGDPASATLACTQPAGFVADATDCDDADPTVNPGASETCNGLDDDCDGATDEPDATGAPTWYADTDADGYGDPANAAMACAQPSGFVADASDCDDADAAVSPGAAEVCNGLDDDCSGVIDDDYAADAPTWYADADADGFGDPANTIAACTQPSGFLAEASDCDDSDPAVNPAAAETCDGADNDCSGVIDDDYAVDTSTWYADVDSDGFGDASHTALACTQPSGYLADHDDCDDLDPAVNPGATETCDGGDNDCDGAVDEPDAADAATWYADADADGYGDLASATAACTPPSGFAADNTDCDDTEFAVNPGATETCNGVDDDCSGVIDDPYATDAATWYADADADGYGDVASTSIACEAPSGATADGTDCDDADFAVNPGATETCNAVDDDCNAVIDDDYAADATTWYADADTDGFGDPASAAVACSAPAGTVGDDSDCDDGDGAINPAATEVCDGADNDCDGSVDAGVCLDISNVSDGFIGLGEVALAVIGSTTLDTDSGEITGLRTAGTGLVDGIWFEVLPQASGPDLGVFSVDGFSVAAGATLSVTGSAAAVIVSSADSEVAGRIDLFGEDGADIWGTSGPNAGGVAVAGGADGGDGSNNYYSGATSGYGAGAGLVGYPGIHYGNGGGGAGHCWGGAGGMGGSSSAASAGTASAGGDGGGSPSEYGYYGGDGGAPYGVARLEPLSAGSGGGGGVSDTDTNPNGGGGGGGAGGGALQISVDGALSVSGTIDASGGDGGSAWGGAGGGGAGGALLLEALDLTVTGALYAEGGRGGDGNLNWVPSGVNGGAAGAGGAPGGGAPSRESGGGGGAAGWLLLRYLSSVDVGSATLSPSAASGCAGTAAM